MSLDLTLLFQSILFQSLKATVLIGLIFGLRLLFAKRVSPAMKHAVWLLVPVALFVSVPTSWSIFNHLPEFSLRTVQDAEQYQLPKSTETVDDDLLSDSKAKVPLASFESKKSHEISPSERTSTSTGITATKIAVTIWLLGCGGMILLFLRQGIACRRWLSNATPLKDGRILTIFEECVRQSGLRCWILALKSDDIPAPFLIGALRPRLLLPRRFVESASNEDFQNVFLHELAHLKRYDVWTSWLMSFTLIFHWFNPLLWLAVKVMNDDREQACDVMALKKLDRNRRKNYSLLLVSLAEEGKALRRMPGLVGLSETGRQLTGRLETIRRIGSWKPFWTALACVPVLFFALTAITDAKNRRGYFSLIFSVGLERFNEFEGKHAATDGYIRELLTDAEDLNHELQLIVRKIRGGDSSANLLARADEINITLRILMDEIRSPELRAKRKNLALYRSTVLSSLQEQTAAALSKDEELNPTMRQLLDETQRLKNRLTRVSGDLRRAEKLNGYTFELIEESEGIHHKLGVLLDEIRGPSSQLDRQRTLAAEIKRLLTEYRLREEILSENFSATVRQARNDLLSLADSLGSFDSSDIATGRWLGKVQESATILKDAIKEKRESPDCKKMILTLSEKTINELQDIFTLHP